MNKIKVLVAAVAALMLGGVGVADASTDGREQVIRLSSTAAVNCYGNVSIQSNHNANFVSTEMGKAGGDKYMLRARADVVGPWELYTVCRDNVSGLTYIRSQASGRYVSEEEGYSGGDRYMLRAERAAFGPWESFNW